MQSGQDNDGVKMTLSSLLPLSLNKRKLQSLDSASSREGYSGSAVIQPQGNGRPSLVEVQTEEYSLTADKRKGQFLLHFLV
jgi:hypothetical protein